ncbi:MAG: hypothetical protein GY765_42095 [bacterium]|nr:hypothetical protein [bacterium]
MADQFTYPHTLKLKVRPPYVGASLANDHANIGEIKAHLAHITGGPVSLSSTVF